MGNPKLPDAWKAMRGTLKKSRSNPRAPKPGAITIGPPPPELAADEAEVWTVMAPVVNALSLAGAGDLVGLGLAVSTAPKPEPFDNLAEFMS